METNKQYDEIVAKLMQNILAEANLADGKIVLWDFQPTNTLDRLYYHVACIVADLFEKDIYLEMSFWEYLRFKYKNKNRKNLHWVWRKHTKLPDECKTSIYIIVECVREYFKVPITIFDDILKEYYEADK
jgi:hypothetical protein